MNSVPELRSLRTRHRSWSAQPHQVSRRRAKSPGRRLTDAYTKRDNSENIKLYKASQLASQSYMNQSFDSVNSGINGNIRLDNTFYEVKDKSNCNMITKYIPNLSDKESSNFCNIENYNKILDCSKCESENADMNKQKSLIESNEMLSIQNLDKCDVINEKQGLLQVICSFFLWMFKCILKVINVIFYVIMVIILVSMYCQWQIHRCDQDRDIKISTEEMYHNLSSVIVGQEIAIDYIITEVESYQYSHIDIPLLLWFSGWSGTGKSKTANIISEFFSPSQVQVIHSSLIPSYDMYSENLLQNLHSCKMNLVIIDGWDESSDDAFNLLRLFLNELDKRVKQNQLSLSKTIIILVGTRGSRSINEHYIMKRQNSHHRDKLTYEEFIKALEQSTEIKSLDKLPAIMRPIPFLPLEVAQVEKCIENEIKKILDDQINTMIDKESVIDNVIKTVNLYPSNFPLIAPSGCKRLETALQFHLTDYINF